MKYFFSWFRTQRILSIFILLIPTVFILYLSTRGFRFAHDANAYLQTISQYRLLGWETMQPLEGYRAYLFPFLFSLVPWELSGTTFIGSMSFTNYSIVSVIVLLLIEWFILYLYWNKDGFWKWYIVFFLNPLLLIYIPYPLQESFIVLTCYLCIPLLLYFFNYVTKRNAYYFAGVLGILLGTLYMTRSSNLLFFFPGVILLFFYSRGKTLKTIAGMWGICIIILGLLILPQIQRMWYHFGTINPYPQTSILENQLQWGSAYAKYNTNLAGSAAVAPSMPYWNPLVCSSTFVNSMQDRTIVCEGGNAKYTTNIDAFNFFKVFIHMFNALNYDYLKPYVVSEKPWIFHPMQILSMVIVFLGVYATVRKWWFKLYTKVDILWDGMLLLTLAVTSLIAVETRFGLIATLILSLRTVELFVMSLKKEEVFVLFVSTVQFIIVTALLSIYVLSYSGVLSTV